MNQAFSVKDKVMYRTGPQLVQSVGVGVLAEQQHSIGHQLPYKQRGLHWLQLKPFTQSTVAHLGSISWVHGQLVSMLSLCCRSCHVPSCPACLLVPDPAGWSHGMELVLENPSVVWS